MALLCVELLAYQTSVMEHLHALRVFAVSDNMYMNSTETTG